MAGNLAALKMHIGGMLKTGKLGFKKTAKTKVTSKTGKIKKTAKTSTTSTTKPGFGKSMVAFTKPDSDSDYD